jgi:hypothetical protein
MERLEEKSSKWEGDRRNLHNGKAIDEIHFEDVSSRLPILKISPLAFPF